MPLFQHNHFSHFKHGQDIQVSVTDYLQLVDWTDADWTGRQTKVGKRGAINANLPPVLERLGLNPDNWLVVSSQFENTFKRFSGAKTALMRAKHSFKRLKMPGMRSGEALLGL